MIEIKNITKKFGDHTIFNNVSLTIYDGEFLILNGESGCGKTTMLNIIGGLENVDDGEILINGKNISSKKNEIWLYGETIGFLFQNFALIEHKTVEQNLLMVKPCFRSQCSIDQALEKVGLLNKKNNPVFTLSGGEQQRIALARLMVKKCDIILADEPTGSLDKRNAQKVIEIIKELNVQGKTVIMVTHDDDYKKIGSRCIMLNDLQLN